MNKCDKMSKCSKIFLFNYMNKRALKKNHYTSLLSA